MTNTHDLEANTALNAIWIQGVVYRFETELMTNPEFEAELRRMTPHQVRAWIIRDPEFENFPETLKFKYFQFSRTNVANGFAFYCKLTKETIIGVPGTNLRFNDLNHVHQGAMDWRRNIFNTGIGGGLPNNYFNNLRELQQQLELDGANITAITGHSLGGSVAELFGMKYGIQPISFNASPIRGVPVRGLMAAKLPPVMVAVMFTDTWRWFEIGRIDRDSDVIPIRFVTHNDWLQNGVFGFNGYNARTYIVPDGAGHGNYNFRYFIDNKVFIDGIWKKYTQFSDVSAKIKISMRDGIFKIPEEMRVPTNLLGGSGSISITPSSLRTAATNMRIRIGLRMETINNGISLSIRQNDNISRRRSNRISTLARQTFSQIDDHGMRKLFASFNTSYATLEGEMSRLSRIRDTSMPSSFTQVFSNRHGFQVSERSWRHGNSSLSRSTITNAFNNLTRQIRFMINLISRDPFENQHMVSNFSEHRHRPRTSVANAYVSRMNASVEQMMNALNGIGSRRRGSNDAIVATMSDLFNTLQSNISAVISRNEELATQADAIARSRENFDNQAARIFSQGVGGGSFNSIGDSINRRNRRDLRLERSNNLNSRENIVVVYTDQGATRFLYKCLRV